MSFHRNDHLPQEIRITVSDVGIGAAVELGIKPGLGGTEASKSFIVNTLAALLSQLAPEAVNSEFTPMEEDVIAKYVTGE